MDLKAKIAARKAASAARKAAGKADTYPRHVREPGAKPPAAPVPKRAGNAPCASLGAATGDTLPCTTCTGVKMVELRACRVHGECSTDKLLKRDGVPVACCRVCRQYTAPAG